MSAYDKVEETLTGDAFDFRPATQSFFYTFLPMVGGPATDLNQSQYLNVENISQELRLTSPAEGRVSWIDRLHGQGQARWTRYLFSSRFCG